MPVRIGINGFGRIGRMSFRAALLQKDVEIVAVNSTMSPEASAYQLQYDSIHGKLNHQIETYDSGLLIDGRPVTLFSDRNPVNVRWGEWDIDVLIEATGQFNSTKACEIHLKNGAKKVVITAPSKDETPTFVMGVNDNVYDSSRHHIISNASCTTNCLAPVAKVLHEKFGIVSGLMTTVHAFTTDQRSLDNSHKDPRRSRSCVQSIVPTSTGAAESIGLVLPVLKGKLSGISLRVPIPNVSLVDLSVELQHNATVSEINTALQNAAQGSLTGILEYCEAPLVSVDFLGNSHSAIIDALSTMVVEKRKAKVLAWYDNEWGYSCRVIDLALHIGKQLHKSQNLPILEAVASSR